MIPLSETSQWLNRNFAAGAEAWHSTGRQQNESLQCPEKQILLLFTVIAITLLISGRAGEVDFDGIYGFFALILLISGRAREADLVAIYADRGHFADLRTSLGSRCCRYLQ